jgi:hypothetical protein
VDILGLILYAVDILGMIWYTVDRKDGPDLIADTLINVTLFVSGLVIGLSSPLIRAIIFESIRHPLRRARLEMGNDHTIKIVAS